MRFAGYYRFSTRNWGLKTGEIVFAQLKTSQITKNVEQGVSPVLRVPSDYF